MSSERRPSLIMPIVVSVLMLAIYVGAYYATVDYDIWNAIDAVETRETIAAVYCVPGMKRVPLVGFCFGPIHWLDCRIRPHVWDPACARFEIR